MIKVKKITPMFNRIVTTADRVEVDQKVNGIIIPEKLKGGYSEYQRVIAVGSMVHNLKEGDLVCIDPSAYGRPVHKEHIDSVKGLSEDTVQMAYYIPTIEVDGKECMFIADRDIAYKVEEYEDVKDEDKPLVITPPTIIS